MITMRYGAPAIYCFFRKATQVATVVLMLASGAGRSAVAEEPLLRFAHWNDMHIQATMPFPFRLTNLQHLVTAMNEGTYFPTPDFVIGIGDMVHGFDLESLEPDYELLTTTLAPLVPTYYPVVGNHENSGHEGEAIYEAAYINAFGEDRLNYSFRAGGIEFIMIDDSGSPATNPTPAGAARRQWVKGLLEASPGVPKIITSHMPFVPIREEAVLAESFGFPSYITHDAEMLSLIEDHASDVLAVLSGHLHLSGMVQQNGITHIVTSGTNGDPYDFGGYEVYEDRVSFQMYSLPEELQVVEPATVTHGIPRHAIDYTDAEHPTYELYLRGNPSERSFDIPIPQPFGNGDFEAAPFDTRWSNGAGALEHPGLNGSSSAAYFDNENQTGTFDQTVITGPEWVFEMSFGAADHATGRSLNLGLAHTDSLGINLRTIGDDLQVYDESLGWQTLLANVIDFSVDADGDNDFSSPGDTLGVHQLRIEGHYDAEQPYYDVFLSDAGSTDINDNVASNVQFWQTAAPDSSKWQSLTSVALFATGAAGGDYVVDNVSVVTVPKPVTWDSNESGSWNTASKWSPALVPNANNAKVVLGPTITSPQTLFTNSAVTIKDITFGDTNASTVQQSYAIVGLGSVNLEADIGKASINVLEGSHQFQAVVNLNSATDVNIEANATLAFNNTLNLGVNNLTKTGAGTLQINNALNTSGGVVNASAGIISGSGLIGGDLDNTGATVAPGNSPGTLRIGGNYSQSAGSLEIEINGALAGIEYDVLKVAGNLSISGGSLDVVFNALPGTYQILDVAGMSTGSFDSVNNSGGLDVSFDSSQLFSTGELTVLSAMLGDMDGDLLVNADDVILFIQALTDRASYNTNGFFVVSADFNGDVDGSGTFDSGDLAAFDALFSAASASEVPEPASASLLIVSFCAVTLIGCRRR